LGWIGFWDATSGAFCGALGAGAPTSQDPAVNVTLLSPNARRILNGPSTPTLLQLSNHSAICLVNVGAITRVINRNGAGNVNNLDVCNITDYNLIHHQIEIENTISIVQSCQIGL
jgi:hypothetical protein